MLVKHIIVTKPHHRGENGEFLMKYKVDQDTCIGCELCTSLCPSIFKMDDNGKSVVYADSNEDGNEAMESCPVQAISLDV